MHAFTVIKTEPMKSGYGHRLALKMTTVDGRFALGAVYLPRIPASRRRRELARAFKNIPQNRAIRSVAWWH